MSLIAKDLISETLTGIELGESGEKALSMMNIFQVSHLPVLEGQTLINIINEDDVLLNGFDKKIQDFDIKDKKVYVNEKCHFFNIIDRLAKNDLSLIPVLSSEEEYLGSITQQDIFQYFGDIFTFEFPGSIIELEIPIKDYSLSKISHIVELENTSIIGLLLNDNNKNDEVMDIILKLNKTNIESIISSFERHGYRVKSSFTSNNFSVDILKERYEALMHYLNV